VKLVGFAEAEPGGDPVADMFVDLGSRLDPAWFVLALLIPVAVAVLWFGNRLFKRDLGPDAMEPKGRGFKQWPGRSDPGWMATVTRLEARPATKIAEASEGPVRFEATLASCMEPLGGQPGRESVWRSRVGGRPGSAIAADVVVIADASGRCGIENLDGARVITPVEKHSIHHESMSLYLGDRVEVMGYFTPEKVGEHEDPAMLVYGTLGSSGGLEIRVIERQEDDEDRGGDDRGQDDDRGGNDERRDQEKE
jgi:hypothetical protein